VLNGGALLGGLAKGGREPFKTNPSEPRRGEPYRWDEPFLPFLKLAAAPTTVSFARAAPFLAKHFS